MLLQITHLKNFVLEIACFNVLSAIEAANAGANRIELCDNATEGGTTPSYGSIKTVLQNVNIPVFPIIRPRGGDFLYTNDEFSAMLHDVQLCKQLGCQGVVLGLLKKDGRVDVERTTELVNAAGAMQVTFHRAFDRAANPLQALEDVICTGCKRILTSGQRPTATEGKDLIKMLVHQAGNRIIIMPGSGIRSNNIAAITMYTGTTELHSSARVLQPSAMEFYVQDFTEDLSVVGVNKTEIIKMKEALNDATH